MPSRMITFPVTIQSNDLQILFEQSQEDVIGVGDACFILSTIAYLAYFNTTPENMFQEVVDRTGFDEDYVDELVTYLKDLEIL